MKFIQYYLDCLSHASYLIGDETTGRAVVVDPQRDVAEYLADAKELGLTDRTGHRDPLPRRLPVRPPRAGEGDRREDRLLLGRRDRVRVDGRRRRRALFARRCDAGVPPHPGAHARVAEHRGLRARRRRGPVRRADRRRAVHRRRRPARPAGVDRLHPRGARRQALRLAARQADDAARRDPGVSRPTARARPAARTCRPTCGRRWATRRRRTTPCARPTRRRSWTSSPKGSRRRRATSSTTRSSTARTAGCWTRPRCRRR